MIHSIGTAPAIQSFIHCSNITAYDSRRLPTVEGNHQYKVEHYCAYSSIELSRCNMYNTPFNSLVEESVVRKEPPRLLPAVLYAVPFGRETCSGSSLFMVDIAGGSKLACISPCTIHRCSQKQQPAGDFCPVMQYCSCNTCSEADVVEAWNLPVPQVDDLQRKCLHLSNSIQHHYGLF